MFKMGAVFFTILHPEKSSKSLLCKEKEQKENLAYSHPEVQIFLKKC